MEEVTVGYDGGCGPCVRIWRVLTRLDHRHRLVGVDVNDPSAVESSALADRDPIALVLDLHVKVGRRVTVGFDAWRTLAAAVPLLWPLLLVMRLPGARPVGTRIYRRVADGRSCAVQRRDNGTAVRRT